MSFMKVLCAAIISAMLAPPLMAKVMPSGRPTTADIGALPDYCQARFGTDENARQPFSKRLGQKPSQHIHHHCIGLDLLNRQKVTFDKTLPRSNLQDAINQFNYVLARWPADFPLTAEARNGKGMAEMLLKMAPSGR